jgi:hypothetical protein
MKNIKIIKIKSHICSDKCIHKNMWKTDTTNLKTVSPIPIPGQKLIRVGYTWNPKTKQSLMEFIKLLKEESK